MPADKGRQRPAEGVRLFYAGKGPDAARRAATRHDPVALHRYLAFMNRQNTRRVRLDTDLMRFVICSLVLENHYDALAGGACRLWTLSSLAGLMHATIPKVRRHVDSLEAAGLVETRVERGSRRVAPGAGLLADVAAGGLDWAIDDLARTAIEITRAWREAVLGLEESGRLEPGEPAISSALSDK